MKQLTIRSVSALAAVAALAVAGLALVPLARGTR